MFMVKQVVTLSINKIDFMMTPITKYKMSETITSDITSGEGIMNFIHVFVQEKVNKEVKKQVLYDLMTSDTVLEFITQQLTGKKVKKKREKSDKPRKLSGYIKFGKQKRPQIKADNPDVKSSQEITKLIAEQWKTLSQEEKQYWNDYEQEQ